MLGKLLGVADHHLKDTGREDLKIENVLAVSACAYAKNALVCQRQSQLVSFLDALAALFCQICNSSLLAQTGGNRNIGLVVGNNACQRIILRRIRVNFVEHSAHSADNLCQLNYFGSEFCHLSVFSSL